MKPQKQSKISMLNALKGLANQEDGYVIFLVVLLLPIFISMMGLVLDLGWKTHNEMRLDTATQSIGSTLMRAVDREASLAAKKIILQDQKVRDEAEQMLRINFPDAVITEIEIDEESKVRITTKATVETVFMRVIGIEELEITAKTKAYIVYTGG